MPANYTAMTKDQLLAVIKNLEKQRYGLVWEDKREEVAEQCERELPVLAEDKSREIKVAPDASPTHIIIEGDNYHALYALGFTHRKKIDVIYIDPPYNTGNKSWKYNNDYIDKEDKFRHSKWLSFMDKRLRLAKTLLKDSGVIIVTIDEYESANISLLLNEIFGEDNKLGCVSITHNPRGRSDDKYFATCNEYAYIFARNKSSAKTYKIPLTEEQKELFPFQDDISHYRLLPLKRTGSNSTPKERPLLYYPIYYNKKDGDVSLVNKKGYYEILPLDSDGERRVWRWGKETFLETYKTEIYFKVNGDKVNVFTKDRIKEGRKPMTVWEQPKYDASSHGTMLLKQILGNDVDFDYPKSLYAVFDFISITTLGNKHAIILDFFAGSGTTGHAVLELNKEDGGSRQFFLCTNNENNICEEVTYPRIKKVIEGY